MIGPKTVLIYQTQESTDDTMGGFLTSWVDKIKIKGTLTRADGDKKFTSGKMIVSATHRFSFDLLSDIMPSEIDRFISKDGVHAYDILFVNRPGNQYKSVICDLLEVEKPAIQTIESPPVTGVI